MAERSRGADRCADAEAMVELNASGRLLQQLELVLPLRLLAARRSSATGVLLPSPF